MIALAILLQAAGAGPAASEPCAPGLYLENAAGPVVLAEKLTDHRKVSGLLGYALLGGITSLKVKTVLPGAAAPVRTRSPRPSFVFCATKEGEAAADGGAMGYVGVSASATSPREFRLVRFDVQGAQREVPLSATSITGPKMSAIRKSTVRFETVEIGPGRYRATPIEDMPAGEYGFLNVKGNMSAMKGKKAAPERVFDFAIE